MKRKNGYLFTLELLENDNKQIKKRILKFYNKESNTSFTFLNSYDQLFTQLLDLKDLSFLPEDLIVEQFEDFFEFGDGYLYYFKEKDIQKVIRHEKDLVIHTKQFFTDKKFHITYSDLVQKILQGTHLKNFKIFLKDLQLGFDEKTQTIDPKKNKEENDQRVINFLENLGKIIIRDNSLVGCNILLYGPPGTGKSPFVRKLAEHI
jgi:hypothetical protein